MIQSDQAGGVLYANNDTIAVAGTAQLCAAGAEATTFGVVDKFTAASTGVRWLLITHATGALWIAKDATAVAATAGGDADDRIYIGAGTTGLLLPWSGNDVFFLNAVVGETPSLYVVGWY